MPFLGSFAILLAGHDGIDHGRGWDRAMESWLATVVSGRILLIFVLLFIGSLVATVIVGIPLSVLYLRFFKRDDPDEV